jgi:FkbM family methyltransferase
MRILQGPARNLRWIAGAGQPNFWLGTYERKKVQEFYEWLKPSSVVYDVGANAGYYSLVAARRSAEVYAFEPFPENAFFLREHFRRNDLTNCHATESAVGNMDGFVSFTPGRTNCEGKIDPDGLFRFRCVRLDTFCDDHPAPDVLKIDVEGAELDVLKGGARMIPAKRPAIFLATHSDELDRECRAFLAAFGYRIRDLDHRELLATVVAS